MRRYATRRKRLFPALKSRAKLKRRYASKQNGDLRRLKTIANSKGQIVIPSSIRRKLRIKEGTRIQIELDEDAKQIILKPITRDYVHSLRGRFKGKGLMKSLMSEKKQERAKYG